MIIIGEKINGAIPAVRKAIEERDSELIQSRAIAQDLAGADYIDCAPGTVPDQEYKAMVWLIEEIQKVTEKPICIDSPNARLLARIIEEGHLHRPGIVNSVNEEGDKCEMIFPLLAETQWEVIGLTCDDQGIPEDPEKKIAIARTIIQKADFYGVARERLHIDPCVMALAAVPSAMKDFEKVICEIHDFAPEVKITGAISNISYDMPARKYVNICCMAYAIHEGLDSAIMDPLDGDLMSSIYACEALCMKDRGGRKYNKAYRRGKIGTNRREDWKMKI